MQLAVKKYAASGTAALMGAGVMLSVPIAQRADIALPELRAPVVELSAIPSWLTGLTVIGGAVVGGVTDLALNEIANPLPIASQVVANQFANGQAIASGVVEGIEPVATAIVLLPATAALIVDTAINSPQNLPLVIGGVLEGLSALPAAALEPILNALDDAVQSTLANAAGVFNVLATETPALITQLIRAKLAVDVTVVGTAINVVNTALTDPLGVPDAIGNGVLATAAVTVGVVGETIQQVGQIRSDIVDVITPPVEATTTRLVGDDLDVVDPRPAIRALQAAGEEVQRGIRVGTQVARSSAHVSETVATASGAVAGAVVTSGVEVGSAVLSGNRTAVRTAITNSQTRIGGAIQQGRDDVRTAVGDARDDVRAAAADPSDPS